MIYFEIKYQTIEGKTIIVVQVSPGTKRPYYLKSKRALNGTYVRISGTTRKTDEYIVKELTFQGENRCYDQTETFGKSIAKENIDALCESMYKYALRSCTTETEKSIIKRVEAKNLVSWGLLIQREEKFFPTNGFLLLTSNPFSEAAIQCGVFKGTDRTMFLDRKEYHGALFEEIDEAYTYVLKNLRLGSEINGLFRKDIIEIPASIIRELITNGVSHRSYLDPSKMQIAIFDDRLEITSPGMLIGGLSIEDIKQGCSKPRNRGLVNAFAYMRIIELWGSGIPRVIQACKDAGLPDPELTEIGGNFRESIMPPKTNARFFSNSVQSREQEKR